MYGSSISIKKNLNYIRIILSLCLILLSFYNYNQFFKIPFESISYIFILFLSNIFLLYLKPHYFKNIKFHYVIFLLDISLIIIGIAIFTVADIPFLIAIFLTLLMAAMGKSTGLSLIIALVVNIIYIYIKVGLNISIEILNEKFLLNIPFIFIVALHSTYLAEKVEEEIQEKLELEKINKFLAKKSKTVNIELTTYIDFIDNLLNNLNIGIIVLDNEGVIKIFTQKCEKIFNIKAKDVEEKPLIESKLPEIIIKSILDFKFKNQTAKDIEVKINNEEKIKLNIDYIKAKEEIVGIICEIY